MEGNKAHRHYKGLEHTPHPGGLAAGSWNQVGDGTGDSHPPSFGDFRQGSESALWGYPGLIPLPRGAALSCGSCAGTPHEPQHATALPGTVGPDPDLTQQGTFQPGLSLSLSPQRDPTALLPRASWVGSAMGTVQVDFFSGKAHCYCH